MNNNSNKNSKKEKKSESQLTLGLFEAAAKEHDQECREVQSERRLARCDYFHIIIILLINSIRYYFTSISLIHKYMVLQSKFELNFLIFVRRRREV